MKSLLAALILALPWMSAATGGAVQVGPSSSDAISESSAPCAYLEGDDDDDDDEDDEEDVTVAVV